MIPSDSFAELELTSQERLVDFLGVELDLIDTLHGIWKISSDAHHKRKVMEKINKALDAIHHFEARIKDSAVREQIHKRAEEFEKVISQDQSL